MLLIILILLFKVILSGTAVEKCLVEQEDMKPCCKRVLISDEKVCYIQTSQWERTLLIFKSWLKAPFLAQNLGCLLLPLDSHTAKPPST